MGTPLPREDHVARYCSPSKLAEGDPKRALPTAFQVRPKDKFLSVNWLEFHHADDRSEQLRGVREVFTLRLSKNGRFAVLSVGKTEDQVRDGLSDSREIRFEHVPSSPDDSHSGIYGTNHSDAELMIATLIAESVIEMHPAL